ncbi:MAG: hypothetical protein ACLQGP_32010 [Isosphaeraceae bacterium]
MVPTLCRSGIRINRSPIDPGGGARLSAPTDPGQGLDGEPVIGMVVFLTHKREQAEAILDRKGGWRCPKLPVLDRVLNALHDPTRDADSELPFGHAALTRVAAWLKGEVRFHRSA